MKYIKKLIYVLLLTVATQVATAQIKILYGPYLQNVKENEATIVWVADKPSIGWVELAPNDGTHYYGEERPKYFDTTNGVKNTSLLHAVKVKALTPGTTYRYRIYSQEVLSHEGINVIYGRVAASDVYKKNALTFTTCDSNKKETSFVMINDIHGRENIITKLLNNANYKDKDLIIFNGDMVSEFKDEQTIFNGFMKESIDLFASEKPMYYARGNHETRGEFATSFQKYFSPKEPFLYYLFRQGPVCFIMLDTGEDKPDSDIEYSGITDYDGYRTDQVEWMKELYKNEDFKQAKFKVVIAVYPQPLNILFISYTLLVLNLLPKFKLVIFLFPVLQNIHFISITLEVSKLFPKFIVVIELYPVSPNIVCILVTFCVLKLLPKSSFVIAFIPVCLNIHFIFVI